jgi:CRISPR-associated protein Cas6
MVDLSFRLHGADLPRDHRWLLSQALAADVGWLASESGGGVHEVNVVTGTGDSAWLSARSRLLLRVPRTRVSEVAALSGRRVQVGTSALQLGEAHARELLPHATMYAHFVDAQGADEAAFLDEMGRQLQAMGVAGHRVCGRAAQVQGPAGALSGFSLMLHGLSAAHAQRLLEHGLGPNRYMGCGLFVPHKSAAAVGD